MKLLITYSFLILSNFAYCQGKVPTNSWPIEYNNSKVVIGISFGYGNQLVGNVKRLVEIRHLKNLYHKSQENALLPMDTINFQGGSITSWNLPIDFLSNDTFNSRFFDKYEMTKKQDVNDHIDSSSRAVDKINYKGDKIGVVIITKDGDRWDKQDIKLDNMDDDVVEITIFKMKDSIKFREAYKYNRNKLLKRIIDYGPLGEIDQLVFITYQAFDKKNNWIKRTETRKSPSGKITGVVVVQRKITYY